MVIVKEFPGGPAREERALVERLLAAGRMESGDVTALRRHFDSNAPIGRSRVESLFALDRGVADKHGDWNPFFVETVTDFVVWQSRPTGVLNHHQADWLLAQADACRTIDAFALLVNVLAEAGRVPASFPAAVHERAKEWPALAGALRKARAA